MPTREDRIASLSHLLHENGWVEDELRMAMDGEDAPPDHELGPVHFEGEDKGGS